MSNSAEPAVIGVPGAERALRACGCSVTPRGSRAWDVRAAAHDSLQVLAEDCDWLLLSAGVPSRPSGNWDALRRANHLPPFFKLALTPGGVLELRAELPMDAGFPLSERVAQVIESFPGAFTQVQSGEVSAAAPTVGPHGPEVAEQFNELLAQTGWPRLARGQGIVAVALEAGEVHRDAVLSREPGGSIRVCATISAWPRLGPASRAALSRFLLSLSHSLRLARGFVRATEEGFAAGFEVLLASEPNSAELEHAFSALSEACRYGAEEIFALEDATLAKGYLRVCGEKQIKQNKTKG